MKVLLLDCYTDEPACLGVPPYISPYVRLIYGALTSAGAEVRYATVDMWRAGTTDFDWAQMLVLLRRVAVPGKYLRGMPASNKELETICAEFDGPTAADLGTDCRSVPASLRESFDIMATMDLDAGLHDLMTTGSFSDRTREIREWNSWLVRGAEACARHPDRGGPLIAEVQMYRGCVRYISGGCKFCIEPMFGSVSFRDEKDIIEEVRALHLEGVRNIRLGAQSCVYCYKSEDTGRSEAPRPNVTAVKRVLEGVVSEMTPEVFHLDNANPAVISSHPEESREITRAIVRCCTSGNVLAFGLESADPRVMKANNLNSTADESLEAIRLVNDLGGRRGASGLPHLLPGINFVCGLDGETKETYRLNLEFLEKVAEEGLLFRRVNIRQVIPSRTEHPRMRYREEFSKFKRAVREKVDLPMMDRLLPDNTVLKGVHTELKEGGRTFGRQAGTYPILVGLPYPFRVGLKVDVAVTGRGPRSVVAILHPTDANSATMSMLEAVPGIGRKRAMSIVRGRPFKDAETLWSLFEEQAALRSAQFHLTCGKVQEQ